MPMTTYLNDFINKEEEENKFINQDSSIFYEHPAINLGCPLTPSQDKY